MVRRGFVSAPPALYDVWAGVGLPPAQNPHPGKTRQDPASPAHHYPRIPPSIPATRSRHPAAALSAPSSS
ncbi:hypothetical protein GCM10010394_23640 [Streptomyces crystallinus]|uniref:Uncharacterized protein n=1 Tax=Streptomyces crystallinus TaxID=68191 RepID=A0ABN1FLW5_9ACTN